ncbi:hypothetical protein ACWG8W_06055 [Citricoccus zhacaiensis]
MDAETKAEVNGYIADSMPLRALGFTGRWLFLMSGVAALTLMMICLAFHLT